MSLKSHHLDSPFGLLIFILCLFPTFWSYGQDNSETEELIINTVEDEVRYESLLDYELDFDQVKRFLTTEQLFLCHQKFAGYFSEKYDYSRALMHSLEALKFAEQLDDLEKQGAMHLEITEIHLDIQNPDEAVKSAVSAIDVFITLGDTFALINSYNSLANSYLSKGEFPSALKWYKKSLNLTIASDNPELSMVPISNIGAYYLFTNKPDSALIYIDQAVAFDRHHRNQQNLAMAYGNKAYAYVLKEDYITAETYFDSSFAIAINKNLKVVLLNLYKDRSDMYYAKGDFKKSYDDLVHYQKISDSLKNSVSSEQISDWKVAFANEEKKRELIKEQSRYKELQLQEDLDDHIKWFVIIILSLIALVITALFWRFRTKSRKSKQLLQKDLELERLKSLLAKKSSKS